MNRFIISKLDISFRSLLNVKRTKWTAVLLISLNKDEQAIWSFMKWSIFSKRDKLESISF